MPCLSCGVDTPNPKFCSKSCAAKYNNKGIRRHGSDSVLCLNCNTPTRNPKFCCQDCQFDHMKKLSDEAIESDKLYSWWIIKKYLIKKSPCCSECGISEWNGKPIGLECDHIDGDITNNRLSNARLLCPNCHSQTSTYRAKNKDNPKGKEERRKRTYLLKQKGMADSVRLELTTTSLED